ncbi:MAG: hypothetical protein ACOYL8_04345 [Patescibacteria group bacterium]
MKKMLLVFGFMFSLSSSMLGQFRDNVNISLFTGISMAQKNANNQGDWYGMYLDYMLIKTPRDWGFGLCAVASQTEFKSNDTKGNYNGSSSNFGAGLAAGKYFDYFTNSTSAYFGSNLMLKKNQDIGEGKSLQSNGLLGTYSMTQNDLMISGELNINILKKSDGESLYYGDNIFPRSQLRLFFQETLNAKKNSFWNNNPIHESSLWNKASYNAEFKQSIYQIGRYNVLTEPKIILGYNYFKGDKSNWLIYGTELALKKRGWDDFLSVYFQVKQKLGTINPNDLNSTQFVIGLSFSPSNIGK